MEACNEGFLDLFIPDIRANQTGEIDLNGLPWDQISEDVENFTGQTIDTLKYTQIGPGMYYGNVRDNSPIFVKHNAKIESVHEIRGTKHKRLSGHIITMIVLLTLSFMNTHARPHPL